MCIAIVILNWRNSDDTLAALSSVLASDYTDFKIIVCDNASSDGSEEAFLNWSRTSPELSVGRFVSESDSSECLAQAFAHRIVWVQTGGNLGFAGGNNVGLRLALRFGRFEYFWLLNNDCVVEPGAMRALRERMQEDASLGMCGAQLRYFGDMQRVQAYGGATHNLWTGCGRYVGHGEKVASPHSVLDVERNLSYVCGASMFVRRSMIEKIGLMTEDYFLYFEEIDWAKRMQEQFRLGYCREAVVYHKEGATIGSSSDTRRTSRMADFYLFRNRLRFTARFYPYALPSVWAVMLLQAVRRGLRGRSERMWLILSIMLGLGKL